MIAYNSNLFDKYDLIMFFPDKMALFKLTWPCTLLGCIQCKTVLVNALNGNVHINVDMIFLAANTW